MTETHWREIAELALFWLVYFALHSALASLHAKQWVASHYPARLPIYRLGFNALALIMLLPILWLMLRHPARRCGPGRGRVPGWRMDWPWRRYWPSSSH